MAQFITGEAGTGKTTKVRNWNCILTATTGAAAVNLDCSTIASTLGYSTTEALVDNYRSGALARKVIALHQRYSMTRRLVIDECSMLEAEQLDILYRAIKVNTGDRLEIVLVGDFAQLPPVNGKFAFEAECWPHFEANMTRLTEVHRQEDPAFLEALRAIRHGNPEGAYLLRDAGAEFTTAMDTHFNGVTICPTNKEADNMNSKRLLEVDASPETFMLTVKGKPDLGKQVPLAVMLRAGARVMITCNDTPEFTFANGDMGIIRSITQGAVRVTLDRTGQDVLVFSKTRKSLDYSKQPPKWLGEYTWMPVKVAYAMTIHKAQGLTLPRIQLPIGHSFAEAFNMMYVACSRVRRASDLRIVGTVERLAKCIQVHPKVTQWL